MSNNVQRPRQGLPDSSIRVEKANIKNRAFKKDDVDGINNIIGTSLVLKLMESESFVIIVYEEVKEPSRIMTVN